MLLMVMSIDFVENTSSQPHNGYMLIDCHSCWVPLGDIFFSTPSSDTLQMWRLILDNSETLVKRKH